MAKKAIGLASVEMGAIAADGGMGTVLTLLGPTVSDTALLANEAATTNDFTVEELDDPFYSNSTPGKLLVTWSIYDVDTVTLARIFGGTSTAATVTDGAKWEAADATPVIEQSLKFTTKDGWVIEIPRAKIEGILQWHLKKTALAQIDLTATVLKPTKTGEKKLTVINPELAEA